MKQYMLLSNTDVCPFATYNDNNYWYYPIANTKVKWYFTESDIIEVITSDTKRIFWLIKLPNTYILMTGEAIKGFAVDEQYIIEIV